MLSQVHIAGPTKKPTFTPSWLTLELPPHLKSHPAEVQQSEQKEPENKNKRRILEMTIELPPALIWELYYTVSREDWPQQQVSSIFF